MNKRLHELMLEAGYAAPEMAGRAQKLAELIVRECALTARNYVMDHREDDYISSYWLQDTIKERFGVE